MSTPLDTHDTDITPERSARPVAAPSPRPATRRRWFGLGAIATAAAAAVAVVALQSGGGGPVTATELSLTPGMNVMDGFLTSHLERTFYKHESALIREYLGAPDDIAANPLGLLISDFSWSRER